MPLLSRRLIVLAGCSSLLPISFLRAAESAVAVTLDPKRTRIEWTLNGNVHDVHGTFHLKQGSFTYDAAAQTVRGEFVADATSGESGNGARDKRMHASILESNRFPEVKFIPQTFSAPAGSATEFTTTVAGSFTLQGNVHPLSIPMSVKFDRREVTAAGSFAIPYVDWGLKDPSTFIFRVNKQVQIHVTAVGQIAH